MKSCSGRLSQGVLVLAVLIVLFVLPAFIKEPSTKPARYQFTDNIKGRPQVLLQKATSQATPGRQRTSNHGKLVQEEGALVTPPRPTAHPAGVGRRAETNQAPRQELGTMSSCTVQRTFLEGQEKDTAPPRGQVQALTSVRTEQLELQSRDRQTTQRGHQKGKHQSNTVTMAKTLWASRPPGAMLAKTRKQALATTVPAKKAAPVTPSPARLPNPTTQGRQILKAQNFKSEPRWNFEERYSLDVGGLQTTCPDSLKVRASKSPWLRDLFLPNLTLFLDSGHFNQSEWERLEHFAPPFGFMELNQSLVQKVVTRFPRVPQQQLLLASLPPGGSRCTSCAVVGNGGILNNSRMGQEIDSHDYVFRVSGAVIKGFEQDVGTRTSFYGFTAFSLTQSILILGNRGFRHVPLGKDVRYLHFLEGTRDYEWLEAMLFNHTLEKTNLHWFRHRPQEAFQKALELDRYLLLHPDFLRYMKNRFLRSKTLDTVRWRIYRPTTGALLLLTALHLCDKVSAYGFITEGHKRFSDHYYDKSWKQLVFYINHDFGLERTVWKRLHDEGIIRLYQRP